MRGIIPQEGFTLVELMVTIAVMAIIALMAAPSFTQTIRKNELIVDTSNFVNLLTETRSEAVFKQTNRVLALDSSVTTFYKKWTPSSRVEKYSGVASITYNRQGQSAATTNLCFVFQHALDNTLKSYIYVQKDGIVFYDKSAASCPN
ncbi:prepilin-type N-terminal cleavage/methylation domain-containing protein [Acinetobacter baumannii]|uniref:pilus assembly FimT family protein n=1 Tax=Acinetobacter baumannii TaxID=470 RepID=UPI0004131562|nr:prepilin-type N-terminal cleavage/methylation domain-containing protein [Acinetobacter baumannii]MDC4509337.1 prepilin-type N-terminal cleavage/methylation domain-containing protein [Acinetobacter baumannii]